MEALTADSNDVHPAIITLYIAAEEESRSL